MLLGTEVNAVYRNMDVARTEPHFAGSLCFLVISLVLVYMQVHKYTTKRMLFSLYKLTNESKQRIEYFYHSCPFRVTLTDPEPHTTPSLSFEGGYCG